MIDLREPRGVIPTLDDALRRFEKGGPPPVGALGIFTDFAGALDVIGPAPAGLDASQWQWGREITERALRDLHEKPPEVQARVIERALRDLRSVFSHRAADASRLNERGRGRRVSVEAIVVFLLLVVALPLAVVLAGWSPKWLVLEVFFLPVAIDAFKSGFERASDPDFVRSVATQVAPDEELQLACRVDRGILSPDQVLSATDRRISLVQPARGESPSRVIWSVAYSELTSFTSERVSETSERRVILSSGTQRYEVTLPSSGAEVSALSWIVAKHRPATAGSLSIRLDDSGFKKLLRTVRHTAGTDRGTSTD